MNLNNLGSGKHLIQMVQQQPASKIKQWSKDQKEVVIKKNTVQPKRNNER